MEPWKGEVEVKKFPLFKFLKVPVLGSYYTTISNSIET